MTGTIVLLDLAGWVSLLLWGIHMIRTGVQRAYGSDLRRILGASLNRPLKAALAGLGVTLLLQSSTATGLMATAFAAGGLVELVPALAVMLGANVGTALIVKALSFDFAKAAPVLVLVGAVVFRRASGAKGRALGRVAIGLGLILLALIQLIETLAPYGDAPGTRALVGVVSADPVIAVLLAAFLAWAAHSSVAVVLLVAAFAQQGIVPLETALALVLGANLGSSLNPLVASREEAGRRVALGNVLVRLVGCALALPLLSRIEGGLGHLVSGPGLAVADFHLLFNAVLALVALPLLAPPRACCTGCCRTGPHRTPSPPCASTRASWRCPPWRSGSPPGTPCAWPTSSRACSPTPPACCARGTARRTGSASRSEPSRPAGRRCSASSPASTRTP
ncbi:MAG TPA: Na/Pi symporter [Methylobacterium sp.]|nr:Na/Pi symporter [Methylobacterium sp.]